MGERSQKICVAALTCGRPAMLQSLLQSWSKLVIPGDVSVEFLIVENDQQERSKDVVSEFAGKQLEISYILEPRRGIPFARNRAIDFVVERDVDLLLFVDDDETTPPLWLVQMLAAYRQSGALLIGGPVLATLPACRLRGLQKSIFKGIDRRYRNKALRARHLLTRGQMHRTTIVTSNWLGHRDLFTVHGLRFDETMSLSGGSDAKFDREARLKGLRRYWASFAYVDETLPDSRISVQYQFKRGRDQSIVSYQQKVTSGRKSALLADLAVLPLRALAIFAMVCVIPLVGAKPVAAIARNSGWLAGRISARFGKESRLYSRITGH